MRSIFRAIFRPTGHNFKRLIKMCFKTVHWFLGDFADSDFVKDKPNELPSEIDILLKYLYKVYVSPTKTQDDKKRIFNTIRDEVINIWKRANIPIISEWRIYTRIKDLIINFEKVSDKAFTYNKNNSNFIQSQKESYERLFDISKCKCYSEVVYTKNATLDLTETSKFQKLVIQIENETPKTFKCECNALYRFLSIEEIRLYLSSKHFNSLKKEDRYAIGQWFLSFLNILLQF